jgi:hypothetical protein
MTEAKTCEIVHGSLYQKAHNSTTFQFKIRPQFTSQTHLEILSSKDPF